MATQLLVLVGTGKGAFVLQGDADRTHFVLRGPYCDASPINQLTADRVTGTLYGASGGWFGPAVWRSADLGVTWERVDAGLAYDTDEPPLQSVWSVSAAHGRLWAGVQPAGLFTSDDGGRSWTHASGLRAHPTRPHWQPGGAGLILHTIVPHATDPQRLWVGISTGGVFHSADGGSTWEPRNRGTRNDYAPEEERYADYGQCVHSLCAAAGRPERLYQQNHCGAYRSDDGGLSWESIEAELPSSFGFASAAHPRDPDTAYLLPLNGDSIGRYVPDGAAAVWRTEDAGQSWQALREGLPQRHAYFGVLRRAMATDALDPAGVYFGTTTGSLFASRDEGQTWTSLADHLPPILSVEAWAVDG